MVLISSVAVAAAPCSLRLGGADIMSPVTGKRDLYRTRNGSSARARHQLTRRRRRTKTSSGLHHHPSEPWWCSTVRTDDNTV